MSEDALEFAAEGDTPSGEDLTSPWRILIVDDEPDVHASTQFALADVDVLGRQIEFLSAYSAQEAKGMLKDTHDIAVVLLDVVMEAPDAGLNLVNFIRQELRLMDLRIILRTGQPGYAPEVQTIRDYDINDYKNKAELTRQKLYATVATAVRAYSQILQLNEYAYYDRLCKLPNRNRLLQDLQKAMQQPNPGVLAIVDIDEFASLNDTLGYQEGDRLLQIAADRLRTAMDTRTVIARIGNDAFGILGSGDSVTPVAIRTAFERPFNAGGGNLQVSTTSGWLDLQRFDGTATEALQSAAMALKQAKRVQPREDVWFDLQMGHAVRERVQLLQGLKAALAQRHLNLYVVYQPKIDLLTLRPCGTETLLRWRTEEGRHIPPDHFIGLAEHSGLIGPIGEWVLRSACFDAKKLQVDTGLQLPVAVNVSAVQLRQPGFSDTVRRALSDAQLDPALLELELTESTAADNYGWMADRLHELKATGVSLAIDDFGTGFSSLSHLRHLPLDRLKIDRSFVADIGEETMDRKIATMIIDLARTLSLRVVAEGVECEPQADLLRELGCHEAQGYWFAKPMAYNDLVQWLGHESHT
jgi:diguanylate cyclase (GGDEF)-like protein